MQFTLLSRGTIQVDGGAMFGIVPYVFWSKAMAPDGENRITLAIHSLLIQGPSFTALVDPGGGTLLGDDYGFREEKPLIDQLSKLSLGPEDISHILLTHLHTDHIEGLFGKDKNFLFPHSQIVIQKREMDTALQPSLLEGDYLLPLVKKLAQAPHLRLVDSKTEIAPDLWVASAPGHTPGHQIILARQSSGRQVVFAGDLIPTALHLPLPYISSFDLEPKTACDQKEKLLSSLNPGDKIIFCHDLQVPAALWKGDQTWEPAKVNK